MPRLGLISETSELLGNEGGIDLFRVGEPSLGEMYLDRWAWSRGTGGYGAGVYAFRGREAAERNIEQASPGKELFVLRDALKNPLQPDELRGTTEINRFFRQLDRLRILQEQGLTSFDEVREKTVEGESVKVNISTSVTGERVLETGQFLTNTATAAILNTPELREKYGIGGRREMVLEGLDAVQEAIRECRERIEAGKRKTCVQPANKMFWPEFDGVCPEPGAGGNRGDFGCVVFKEKIDRCVGRETRSFEKVSAELLNKCFTEGGS